MIKEIQDLIRMAGRWREWEESQITGENDDFLLRELEEKIERWLFPHLKLITKDDNEFYRYGAEILDNVHILALEIKKAGLEKLIRENRKPAWWERIYDRAFQISGRKKNRSL